MFRFFTASFGETYVLAAKALLRSIEWFTPNLDILVFTDQPEKFPVGKAVGVGWDELVAELDEYHRAPSGQLRNSFKFKLFERMRKRYPLDDLCWIDADILIFVDLQQHFIPGCINEMAHRRRNNQFLNLGDGLSIKGDRYAIGGLYALPAGRSIDFLNEIAKRRPGWADVDKLVRSSGDQITLNHLVHRSGLWVHWFSDDQRFIYNLEFGSNIHPVVGDVGLMEIELRQGLPVRDGRQFAVFCWIKSKLDAHIADDFSSFKPDVSALLKKLYAC